MASTIVSRTQSGSESAAGRKTWTFSAWIKRTGLGSCELFGSDSNGARSNNYNVIGFTGSDQLDFEGYESGTTFRKITNKKFRDTNAWYHLVIAFDTTQSTADDRIKIYINGVRETSFGTSTNPSQDHQGKFFAQNKVHAFGRSGAQFDGLISHCHATEGTAYAPTVFGSQDATTGEWKINTSPTVSYGTNGFFLFKNDNSVTNQAGNSSGNFTVSAGTLTKTEDNPSNVFATMNPLNHDYANTDSQLLNGSTYVNPQVNGSHNYAVSTLGMPKGNGKFYAEAKLVQYDNSHMAVGIVDMDYVSELFYENRNIVSEGDVTYLGRVVYSRYGYVITGGGTETQGFGATYTNGDILQIACDMENGAIYFGKNGTWQNSGDPTSGASRTGAVNTSAASWWTGTSNWGFWCGDKSTTGLDKFAWNFGNGYFQSTAVSSAGTNASNNGIFEYDVPTGYTALSTKGLNE